LKTVDVCDVIATPARMVATWKHRLQTIATISLVLCTQERVLLNEEMMPRRPASAVVGLVEASHTCHHVINYLALHNCVSSDAHSRVYILRKRESLLRRRLQQPSRSSVRGSCLASSDFAF
jgi:hypothetical protein